MEEEERREFSEDEIFYILSNQRRRYVLYYLKQHDGPVELMEVVRQLAAWEEGISVDEVSEQAHKRAYVALYQTHIPRLEEAGLVEYDPDSGLLTLSADSAELDPYIGSQEGTNGDSGPTWYLYYGAVVAANAVLFAAVVAGLLPIDQVVANVIAILSLVTLALVHALYSRRTVESESQFA